MQRKTPCLRKWVAMLVCLVVLLLVAVALATCGFSRHWHDRLLATWCEEGLVAASEEQAATTLSRLMTLREPGMAAVVRAIGNPAPATSELAYRTLADELNRWDSGPLSPATAERLKDLAQAMADNIDALPDAARQRVAVLAMRILPHCQQMPVGDRGTVIAACHRVLDIAATQSATPHNSVAAPGKGSTARREATNHGARVSNPVHPPSTAALDLAQFSPPPLARADGPAGDAHSEPALFIAQNAAALAEKPQEPQAHGRLSPITVAGYTTGVGGAQTDDEAAEQARREARELDVIHLFTRLHSSQPEAVSARAELEARGFSPRQIEVGQHLVSPDAEERLRWTEWLPGIRGIDARFWLLRLSHDSNAQVRRAAVGLLATDRDPEVVRRLQRIVVEETDDRIREQANRTLEADGEP